jgi:hypothetical protein
LREERRDLPLAKRTVERVVDVRHGHAEPARRVAVDLQERLQAAILQVARHVGQLRQILQARDEQRNPFVEQFLVRRRERELILRAAHAILDRQFLHRLHVERDAFDVARHDAQSLDDFQRRFVALGMRLEIDEHAPAVERGIGAVHADEG